MGGNNSNSNSYHIQESLTYSFPQEGLIFEQLKLLQFTDILDYAKLHDLDNCIWSLFFNKDKTKTQVLYCIYGYVYTGYFIDEDKKAIEEIYCFLLINKGFRNEAANCLIKKGNELNNKGNYYVALKCYYEAILISGRKNIIETNIRYTLSSMNNNVHEEKIEVEVQLRKIKVEFNEINCLSELDEYDIDFDEIIESYAEEIDINNIQNGHFSLKEFCKFISSRDTKNKIDDSINKIVTFIGCSNILKSSIESMVNTAMIKNLKQKCYENKRYFLNERKQGKISREEWDTKRKIETSKKTKEYIKLIKTSLIY